MDQYKSQRWNNRKHNSTDDSVIAIPFANDFETSDNPAEGVITNKYAMNQVIAIEISILPFTGNTPAGGISVRGGANKWNDST